MGAVPPLVKADELSARDIAHHRHVTDGNAVGISAPRQQDGQRVLVQAQHLVGMHAPFLLNHASLLVNGAVVKVEFAGQVLEHQQDGVEQGGPLGGDVGYLEPRVVKSRRCVDVAAVGNAVVLQDVHHVDAGEIARALEGDVLDEVCQSALVVFLDQRTGVLHEPELGAAFGLLVVADVVGHAVVELPNPEVGINWQLLLYGSHAHHRRHGRQDKEYRASPAHGCSCHC